MGLERPLASIEPAPSVSGGRWLQPRVFTAILGVVVVLMLAASVYTALLIRDRQRAIGEISRYNVTWVTSQAALEVSRLETTLAELALAGAKGDPTDAQVRFDIVASRLAVLGNGEAGELINSQPDLQAIYLDLKSRLTTAEKLIDQVDQPGVAQQIITLIKPLAVPLAQLAGAAHDAGGNLVSADIDQLRTLHFVFSSMLVALIACCFGLIGVLGLNNRMLSRAHKEVGALVVDLRRTGHELGIANQETLRAAEEIQQQNRALQARDRELALQNTRFDAALNNMSQALCMVGADGRLIVCNQQFLELFAIDAPPNSIPVCELFAEIGQAGRIDPALIRALRRDQQALVDERRPGGFFAEGIGGEPGRDGAVWAIAVSHQPMMDGGWVATYSDITERRIAEIQLAHAQKMEAIGNLTGGMAHDFNNLLAVISLNLEFLLGQTEDQETVRDHASRALQASLRGANLISQLLAFARRQPLAPQRISVNTWIRSIADLLEHTLGESIRIQLSLGSTIWPVNTDATRLETAIANLATNARDAMPQGGTLTILTQNVTLSAAEARSRPDVVPGDYVMIEVADTGTGMAPDVVGRIFEPFFTTKEEGQGTGLGLSMVFGFIRQSGGHIAVCSTPGQGTVFRLHLPRVIGETVGEPEIRLPSAIIGGNETILMVEDNEAVRMITADLLDQLGYQVIEAANPQEALAVLYSDRSIDLLFSDVVMPGGMDGFDLAQEAIVLRPGLRLLLTSGFTEFSPKSAGALRNVRVLGKPFRQSELAHALREALDADVAV